jgi:hypothetical protein
MGETINNKKMKTIIVKVTYTVKPDFSSTNQKNINAFMNDVRKINDPELRYQAYLAQDGKTFVHLASYTSEKAQKKLLELESFKYFQQQRDESGLEVLPAIETLQLVASSHDIFN